MTYNFSIWIDADSCPVQVRNIVSKASIRHKIELFFVANHEIKNLKNDYSKMIIVESIKDSADNYIVENAKADDLVITRDIPLAQRLVEKNIITLNDRGTIFTQENINYLRSIRDFNYQMAQYGITADKTGTLSQKDINNFSNCLDKELQKKIRKTLNKS